MPRIVMFLDPDTKNSAIAVATETRVLAVGVAINRTKSMEGRHAIKHNVAEQCDRLAHITAQALREFPDIEVAVAEYPKDYGKRRWVDPNSLIAVSAVLGAYLGPAGARGVLVWPSEWKGTLNKTICQARAFEHFRWAHTAGAGTDGVRKFHVPESVMLLSDLPQQAMGDLADAVAGAKWAALFGKRRIGAR